MLHTHCYSTASSSTATVRTVWIQIYINILIIYLLTTDKLLHVYIQTKSQVMTDKVKDVINHSFVLHRVLINARLNRTAVCRMSCVSSHCAATILPTLWLAVPQ